MKMIKKNKYFFAFVLVWFISALSFVLLDYIWPPAFERTSQQLVVNTFVVSFIITLILYIGQQKTQKINK